MGKRTKIRIRPEYNTPDQRPQSARRWISLRPITSQDGLAATNAFGNFGGVLIRVYSAYETRAIVVKQICSGW